MQASMADNRPWMPCHNSDQLKPSYIMMTSQFLQRSSESDLTRNSSNFHDSRGIHWQDQFVDHCSMWRPWRGSDHSALVQPHGLRQKRGQVVDGCYFAGAGTTAYSGGASHEAGHVNGFCRREIASCTGSEIPQCQAEGCNANLSSAKQYHRRHKVCELHSKASTVIVCGLIQRFCQQCSRFHLRSEFDERKRSCRKSLAEHNRRRRKPQANASECKAGRSALEDGNHKTKGSSGHEATGPAADIENSESLMISMKNSHSSPLVIETSRSSLDLQIFSSSENVPVGWSSMN